MTAGRSARRRVGARRRRRGLEGEVVLQGFADFDPC
jgi:hypothetical protein